MKIFVARHGQTTWNAAEKVCGISEAPLTEKGLEQASALAKQLAEHQAEYQIKKIYVSPLSRARITAEPVEKALGIKAIVEPRLHEVNFGIYEGVDWHNPDFRACKGEPFCHFPKGESIARVAQRVYNFIDEVEANDNPDNVLFICHGMLSRVIRTAFVDYPIEQYRTLTMGNCEIYQYEVK